MQQAWDYAIDAPGSRWVLVSNRIEIRLYGFGRGRDAYERFDLSRLDDQDEHARLWLILSAERQLGSATDALLGETDSAYKEVTNKLYDEYKKMRDQLIAFLVDPAGGPKLVHAAAIELAQKLLDRILFAELLAVHATDGTLPSNGDPVPWRDGVASERAFWTEYAAMLRGLRNRRSGLRLRCFPRGNGEGVV